jgi:hypothetical protein
MPKKDSDSSALASLLDGSKAGELIPELARHGLQQLIELEVAIAQSDKGLLNWPTTYKECWLWEA